jgi:hypothetical protein
MTRKREPALNVGRLQTRSTRRILHQMENYRAQLEPTVAAIVDHTRRAIFSWLEQESRISGTALAKPFAIKLSAVMDHLDVPRTVTVTLAQPNPRSHLLATPLE